MKHIKKLSARKAMAFQDFLYTVYRAFYDFRFQKKNEYYG
ncbi:MAG: hypothetical protein BWY07_00919 [Candidatus Hydrogenedentes bacterium ADurb.Bin170]|nr:MAG: hypothetical protein BWY07_00919 [Candidatus Hydrogenedentes bacterium ADurb.Bin170]